MTTRAELRDAILSKLSEVLPACIVGEVIVRDNHELSAGTVRVIIEQGQSFGEPKPEPPPCPSINPMPGDRVRITNADACALMCCRNDDVVTLVECADPGRHSDWGKPWRILEHPGWWAWSAFFVVVERGSV